MQKQQVLNHLKCHGSITPLEALQQYGCFRLAVIINRLRNEGHPIDTDLMTSTNNKFARYVY